MRPAGGSRRHDAVEAVEVVEAVEAVTVWWFDLDELARRSDVDELAGRASVARAARLRDATSAARLLARRASLRLALAADLAVAPSTIEIEQRCRSCGSRDHGRPRVVGASVEVSVSASGPVGVVASGRSPLGIDLEHRDGTTAGLDLRPVLTRTERRRIRDVMPQRRRTQLLRLWTAKEAALKADGRGLALDPSTVDASALVTAGAEADDCDRIATVEVGATPWPVRSGAWTAIAGAPGDPSGPAAGVTVLAVASAGGAVLQHRRWCGAQSSRAELRRFGVDRDRDGAPDVDDRAEQW